MTCEEEQLLCLIKMLEEHEAKLDEIESCYDKCERNYAQINQEIEPERKNLKGKKTLAEHINSSFACKVRGSKASRNKCYSQEQILSLMDRISMLNREFNELNQDGIQELIKDINKEAVCLKEDNQGNAYEEDEDDEILRKMGIFI